MRAKASVVHVTRGWIIRLSAFRLSRGWGDIEAASRSGGWKEGPAFGSCRDALEALTGQSVDLVNLRETNTVLQHEIITEGTLIASADGPATDAFAMKVMSAYQKLNEERSGILAAIAAPFRLLR